MRDTHTLRHSLTPTISHDRSLTLTHSHTLTPTHYSRSRCLPGTWSRDSFVFVRVLGFGFRVLGFSFRVSGFGFRVSGFGFRVLGFEVRVSIFHIPCFLFCVLCSMFRFRVLVSLGITKVSLCISIRKASLSKRSLYELSNKGLLCKTSLCIY